MTDRPRFDGVQLQALLDGRVPQGTNPLARDWKGAHGGSCFHRALDVWTVLHVSGDYGWRVALGVVAANEVSAQRHVHAWLERGRIVLSAVNHVQVGRARFYDTVGVERGTVALVNPRPIWRRYRGEWNRAAITELLNLWGKPYGERDGGVVPL